MVASEFGPMVDARKPFFSGAQPTLHFVGAERVGEDAVKLTYTMQRAS